jgi:hypothetical protein
VKSKNSQGQLNNSSSAHERTEEKLKDSSNTQDVSKPTGSLKELI